MQRIVVLSLSKMVMQLANKELPMSVLTDPTTLYFLGCEKVAAERGSSYWIRLGLAESEVDNLHFAVSAALEGAEQEGRVMWRASSTESNQRRFGRFIGLLRAKGFSVPSLSQEQVFDLQDSFNAGVARYFLEEYFPEIQIVL